METGLKLFLFPRKWDLAHKDGNPKRKKGTRPGFRSNCGLSTTILHITVNQEGTSFSNVQLHSWGFWLKNWKKMRKVLGMRLVTPLKLKIAYEVHLSRQGRSWHCHIQISNCQSLILCKGNSCNTRATGRAGSKNQPLLIIKVTMNSKATMSWLATKVDCLIYWLVRILTPYDSSTIMLA